MNDEQTTGAVGAGDIAGQGTFGEPGASAAARVYDAGSSGRLAAMSMPTPTPARSETRSAEVARRRNLVNVTFALPEPLADALEKHAADASTAAETVNPAEIVGGLLVRLMRDTRQSAELEAELADALFAYVGGEVDIVVNRRHLINPKAHRR